MRRVIETMLCIFVGIFLIGIIAMGLQVIGEDSPNKATIFGGLLSMIGGAAGAMGAYLVARHQIKQEKKEDKINLLASELPIYVALGLELDKIVKQLKIIEYKKSVKELKNEPSLIVKFDALRWERWTDINKTTDTILLKELLIFEEAFKRTAEVLEYDYSKKIDGYLRLKGQNSNEAEEFLKEIKTMLKEKEEYFKELTYCLQKAEKIQKVIKGKSIIIEEIIGGKSTIENYQFFSSEEIFKVKRDDQESDPIKISIY